LVLGVAANGPNSERIAVGLGVGHTFRAIHTASAANILNNDCLPQNVSHTLGNEATDQVGWAPCGERDNHGHWPTREILSESRAHHREQYRRSS
jgi:hypothetical protein